MNTVRLPALDVRRLAADFCEGVRNAHTPQQLARIVSRNAEELQPDVDHVHDYVDANELMADAINLQWRDIADFTGTDWSWSDFADEIATAWNRARVSDYTLSRILVACEFSGTVRDELLARGHSVLSCDLLPTESAGPHYQGDVRDILYDGWHKMIAHPECTYLAASQWFRCTEKHDVDFPNRMHSTAFAYDFVRDLIAAPIEQQCIENPVSIIADLLRETHESQFVQPYMFGHDASKNTGLWFKGMGPLEIPDVSEWIAPKLIEWRGKLVKRWGNQSPCGADNKSPSPDRWKLRAKTFPGIARALAAVCG